MNLLHEGNFHSVSALAYWSFNCAMRSHINYWVLVQYVLLQIGVMWLCIWSCTFKCVREPRGLHTDADAHAPHFSAFSVPHIVFFFFCLHAFDGGCTLQTKVHPSCMWTWISNKAHVILHQLVGSSLSHPRKSFVWPEGTRGPPRIKCVVTCVWLEASLPTLWRQDSFSLSAPVDCTYNTHRVQHAHSHGLIVAMGMCNSWEASVFPRRRHPAGAFRHGKQRPSFWAHTCTPAVWGCKYLQTYISANVMHFIAYGIVNLKSMKKIKPILT